MLKYFLKNCQERKSLLFRESVVEAWERLSNLAVFVVMRGTGPEGYGRIGFSSKRPDCMGKGSSRAPELLAVTTIISEVS